ncbi:MAG: hypothetical protein GC160_22960 [Acidobacteria bacterium]|nr:hypothetical protein [Acidobacteriota bacterium]
MLTPFQYVKRYHDLWSPQFMPWIAPAGFYGIGAVQTPVKEYSNLRYKNKAGKSPSERLGFKDDLLRFFHQRAKESDSGVSYDKGDGYSLSGSLTIRPIYDFKKSSFMSSFSGKASPEVLADMIQLISYWRYWQTAKLGKTVAPLATIVESYLGADCNGFIGNYLRAKYAGNSLGPSSTEYTYHVKGKHTRRTKFSEIRMDDVIVWEGYGHVTIIQELIDWGDDWAVVEICESRSKDYGGPQWAIDELTWQTKNGKPKPGSFRMRGQDIASISDVRYV